MALFFHSDEVDQSIPFKEAVQITENALRDVVSPKGVNAPRKRLNLHREIGEEKFDTVLNIYAGGSASYGAIGAQVALHRKAIAGNQQRRPPFNPDQTELALIYDSDDGSLLGVMAHRPRDFTGVADLRTPATSLAGLDLFARKDACRVGIYGAGQQAWATFAGLCELRKIESAKVYSPTPAHRQGFAKKISNKTGVPVKAVDTPDRAAKDVDIVLCMTNTNVPVIDGAWLEQGQYIISVIGSNIELVKSGNLSAPRREIDDGTLRRCDFIVALSKAQAIDSQQGDIYWPVRRRRHHLGQDRRDLRCPYRQSEGSIRRQPDHSLQESGRPGDRRYRAGKEMLRIGEATGQRLRNEYRGAAKLVGAGRTGGNVVKNFL